MNRGGGYGALYQALWPQKHDFVHLHQIADLYVRVWYEKATEKVNMRLSDKISLSNLCPCWVGPGTPCSAGTQLGFSLKFCPC